MRYEAGEATVLEVVDAQTTLADARNFLDDGMTRYPHRRGEPTDTHGGVLAKCRKRPCFIPAAAPARSCSRPPRLLTSACSRKEEAAGDAPAPVQVTAVTQTTVRRIVTGDGVLYPIDQASVMPKIAAPVQKFYVNRGDRVKQGQLLATLENRDLAAGAAEGQGSLRQAESNLRATSDATIPEAVMKARTDVQSLIEQAAVARTVLESRRKLLQEGALARRLVDEAQLTYVQAKGQLDAAQEHLRVLEAVAKPEQVRTATAQVESAKAHQDSLEAQLGYSRIVSPIGGVIADRPLYAGEMATPGAPAAHGDGYLPRGGAREHSAGAGQSGEGGPGSHHYGGRRRRGRGGQSHRGEPRHGPQQHDGPGVGAGG